MEKVYNKLVRDKIPEIIKNNNGKPITRILTENEYKEELENKKLDDVIKIAHEKQIKRGCFKNKIFLEKIIESDD